MVVITGASSGIGRATARRLATDGMRVVAVARRTERLEALAAESAQIFAYTADVRDLSQVTGLAGWVGRELGACDVLINCAGVAGGVFGGPGDVEDVRDTMDVNFMGAVRCMSAFRELLLASAPSHVVNVASVAGKLGVGPGGYAASKFALVGFSEAVGLAWERDEVRVTQLNPGFIKTEGLPQQQIMRTPLARLVGRPEQVADAIAAVLRSRARERTVPRWYRPIVVVRHVAAPLFWGLIRLLPRSRGPRD